ncbi:MAG: hypothetical protein JSV96_01150 [Candidatus Aminicenantes bacterium]|nr:MAG: hypothetical protein JSV96_01150 [Candidatus Aminicenantes bacterium]
MKGKISSFLVVGFVVGLLLLPNLSQAEEQKAQLFFVEEVVVKPSMVAEYEAYVRNVLDLVNKHGFPYPWTVFSTKDLHYFFVLPVDSYAAIDSFFKALEKLYAKIGKENAQALQKKVVGTYKHFRYSCYRHVPEMSYHPENPRLKPEEENFVYMGYSYVIGGKEGEVKDYVKKVAEFCKEKNTTNRWDTYACEFGTDMPLYVSLEFGKSAGDFWTQEDEFHEAHEEEIMKMLPKYLACFRKFEYKTGWLRPELSYMPKEK